MVKFNEIKINQNKPKNLAIKEGEDLRVFDWNAEGLIDRFLRALDIRANSKETYKRGLRQFFTWLKQNRITSPGREDIIKYKNDLNIKGLSALTLSGYLVAVRRFFEWLESIKIYPNIAKQIRGAKIIKGFRKDPLTVEQTKELLNSIDTSTLKGKRDFAIINLLVRTGLRTVEVIRANIEDIRQEGGEVVLWIQGKGRDSKDDFIVLTDFTLRAIQDYLQARGKVEDTEPLFTSLSNRNKNQRLTTRIIRRIVKENLKKIGLNSKHLTAHSLRHTAITLALNGGATIQEAQILARHSDINTTLIYAHNLNRLKTAPERKIDALLGAT